MQSGKRTQYASACCDSHPQCMDLSTYSLLLPNNSNKQCLSGQKGSPELMAASSTSDTALRGQPLTPIMNVEVREPGESSLNPSIGRRMMGDVEPSDRPDS